MPTVGLRPVEDSDLDAIFEQMRDPASVTMAAFTTEDPNDRTTFDSHMARVLDAPDITHRAVTCDDQLVGTIAAFPAEGVIEVTYWIDRSYWGQGVASRALELLLQEVPMRPICARVATDNIGSLRVLEKAGFKAVGTEVSYAAARGTAIEETVLELS
jgi:RimJ/RimL family protein N-acetyltransferase